MPYQSHTARHAGETALLQATVALLAAVPVAAGLAGIVLGPRFLGAAEPWPADLDSHLRFLSGVFVAVGLAWYSCIPDIGDKTDRFRLLAALTVAGGLARLWSLVAVGAPSAGHLYGLGAELAIVPAMVVWQARIASTRTGAAVAGGLYWRRRSAPLDRRNISPGPY